MKAVLLAVAASALLLAAAAQAKEGHDFLLNICNARHCLPIENPVVSKQLKAFYEGPRRALQARTPRLGVAYYELQSREGGVTGIVATAQLNRFLSYGANKKTFQRGRWYRVPPRAAAELRSLMDGLTPLRLSRRALARSR